LYSSAGSRPLKDYLAISWIASSFLAVLACGITSFILAWISFNGSQGRIVDDLAAKSQIVARRLSGELLLGTKGAATGVSQTLQEELVLDSVALGEKPSDCTLIKNDSACSTRVNGSLLVARQIPHYQPETYALISKSYPSFWSSFGWGLFFLSTLPIVFLLGIGVFIQRFFLRKYVLEPIQSLVETSTGSKSKQSHWPREIAKISSELSQSFEAREQSVYAKIAQGVIHDVRNHLQPLLAGTDMVTEASNDPAKKTDRLEKLYLACEVKIKRIKTLLDLALDGGRAIEVRSKSTDLVRTIQGAVSSNESLAESLNVVLDLQNIPDQLIAVHDSIQLERVFTNLIKNGIEASAESKQRSEIGRVSIAVSADERHAIHITVEDSGCGIEGEPDHVFRLLKSTKAHGSGLGLTVSRNIVTAHGGTIIPGRSKSLSGASFEVIIPNKEVGGAV
jgi:signal transduction histidine kinase